MSLTATQCTNCGTSNISSARFCGGCGQPTSELAQAPTKYVAPGYAGQTGASSGDSNWQEMAGLVCGVLSMFLLGIFAAVPGLYFSWTALNKAKANGSSTRLGTIGLVLNVLGIVATFAMILLVILLVAMQVSTGSDPYSPDMYGPSPYGY